MSRTPIYDALTDEEQKHRIRDISLYLACQDSPPGDDPRYAIWEILAKLPKEDLPLLEERVRTMSGPHVQAEWQQQDSLIIFKAIYEKWQAARKRWCLGIVEDKEKQRKMEDEIPELIAWSFVMLHDALKRAAPNLLPDQARPLALIVTPPSLPPPTGYEPPGFGSK